MSETNIFGKTHTFGSLLAALEASGISAKVVTANEVIWLEFPPMTSLHEQVRLLLTDGKEAEERFIDSQGPHLLRMLHDLLADDTLCNKWSIKRKELQNKTHYKMIYLLQPPNNYRAICDNWGTHPDFQGE